MKTIKSKIFRPFLLLLIIVPFTAIIIFNIIINQYFCGTAKVNLANTASGIEKLINRQLTQDTYDAILQKKLELFRGTLGISRLVSNTEFIIIDRNNIILFPLKVNEGFLNDYIISAAIYKLQGIDSNQAIQYTVGGIDYFAAWKQSLLNNGTARILFISSNEADKRIILVVNIVLIVIFLIGVLLSIFIAGRISAKIVKPILQLNSYSRQIGSGNYIVIPEDHTSLEISELAEAMNNMSKSLKEKESIQTAFLQNSSHELRTPLMSIRGYAEGIMTGVFSDKRKAAGVIREESIRLTALVDEILTLSKIENKTYRTEFIEYNLPDLVKSFVTKLQGYALQQNKQIIFECNQEFIPLKADEALLMQAVSNIASNCIKYSKSAVHINAGTEHSKAVICISDDGNGISPAVLPHIFERFYKGRDGNFGLGLSIAKSAVEYMGGSIEAYNNNGAVFKLVFDIKQNTQE